MVRLAVDRPVLTTVIVLALVIVGLFSFTKLSQELRPNVDFPFVTVMTVYPGAGPREVESQVTEPLEEEIASAAGLQSMTSMSLENLSLIICEFELEVDGFIATIEVKDKADAAVIFLPDAVEPPVVQQFDFSAEPVLNVAVNSDRPLQEITELAETRLKDQIARVKGVSKVEIIGGLEREILIACHIDKLRAYGLSILDVVGYVQQENLNFPTGRITGISSEYSLRMVGEFSSLDEIRSIRIPTPSGAVLSLKDIADVRDSYEEPRQQARFQGQRAVSIQVIKKNDANTVQVSAAVHKLVEKLEPWANREQIQLTVANDRATYIQDSIDDALQNILIGIFLTALLLYLFLHDYRSTLIVAVTMPACVIATFSLMYFAGFTLNIISLMALGISIGVLVTNSIVVLESISNKLASGLSARDAAIEGTNEIAVAVGASTMTNVVVFSPIAFMSGIIGRFMLQFGLTVVFATLISLLVSFTLTPMMAKILLSRPKKVKTGRPSILRRFAAAWDRFYDQLASDYRAGLQKNLRHRWVIVLVSIVAFAGGLFLLANVGSEFFPEGDQGIVNIIAKLPPGTSLAQSDRTLQQIAAKVADIPEIETVLSEIGGEGKGTHEGQITLNMVHIEKRERNTKQIADSIRPLLTDIPAAEIQVTTGESGGPGGSPIMIEVSGPELDKINEIAQQVVELSKQVDGIIDIRSSYESGKPELRFVPDRSQMSAYGVTSFQIGSVLRTAFEGAEVTYFREAGEDYDIRVQLSPEERKELTAFETMLIRSRDGYIPLSQLGSVEYEQSETKIDRKNKQRVVTVTGNVSGVTPGDANYALGALMDANINLPPGYELDYAGMFEFQQREFGYIFQALILAIILTYMVLAAILEDFIHPFTVMLTLPLGLVGVGLGLFLGNVTINLMSLMGIIMLVGIVVNNAILILDRTKQLRQQGMAIKDALVDAASTRLRPIIMTNLAIAISVAPQAMVGAGAEFRRALAVVTMGGVLVSAVFTLFLIPAIYTAFDRIAIKPKVIDKAQYDK
jgi:hydrophobic/amphiphilic exporter-1 (mainly G- bacteria), HAE1 family